MRAALQRRADQGVGLFDHGVDIALQRVVRLPGFEVQRALERVVGELFSQGGVLGLERLGVLCVGRRHEQQRQQHGHA
ncbi:hypothetical protein D3C84_1232240 [compost metagenome]